MRRIALRPWNLAFAWLMATALIGCSSKSEPSSEETLVPQIRRPTPGQLLAHPLSKSNKHSGDASTKFERLGPEITGIHFDNPLDPSHPLKRLYYGFNAAGGVAIGDVDSDGRPDVYLVSGPGKNKLYRQVEDFHFQDITQTAGVDGGDAWGAGATFADVDNDGDLDLFVANYDARNQMYINQGDGTFRDHAREMGLDIVDASVLGTFADYDRDGDLDMYLLTYRYYRAGGRPKRPPTKMVNGRPVILPAFEKYYGVVSTGTDSYSVDTVGRPDRLLRCDSQTTRLPRFVDVSDQSGIEGRGHGLSATWFDYDQDGRVDIYVGNDFDDPDRLYRNNGDGTFSNVIQQVAPHTTWSSMGADSGDLNNDGMIDFLSLDMSPVTHEMQKRTMGTMSADRIKRVAGPPPQMMRNSLYLNTGVNRFLEAAYLTDLAESDWSWAAKMLDLNNDGWLDVFITNGMTRNINDSDQPLLTESLIGRSEWDMYENTEKRPERNLAFANRGDLRFEQMSQAWGLDHLGISFAAAHGDFDRDGDLDLIVMNVDEPVSIYRNQTTAGHRVLLRLFGTVSNRFGIGARIELATRSGQQVRELVPCSGFLSCNDPCVHFGLGGDPRIDRLTVTWPSGRYQSFENLEADRLYAISEPAETSSLVDNVRSPSEAVERLGTATRDGLGEPSYVKSRSRKSTLFVRSSVLSGIRHQERPYDDFARQPLLPNKLSQLGPGMAWGDVDGDGKDDLFLSGAAGQPGQVYRRNSGGQFDRLQIAPLEDDASHEDMGALWLDVDSDGDMDLYVVSGGVECDEGSELLRDRLYLNDGKGVLRQAPDGMVPDVRDSGSVVTAADFDRDGDLDLFVGGRVIPGRYPLPASSRLLRNDSGRLTDATFDVAPALAKSGLVTSAIWSDVDADGWIDLLVTHEWGPVKFYRNREGRLEDHTDQRGLSHTLGWWNGIAGGDFDGDGDIDYVVTNFGLNTKYHASRDQPTLLYYGDFDGSGQLNLVEAEFENEVLFPVRGKSCSTRAMPHLASRFTTFRAFAVASLHDIYTSNCLDRSHRFEANTLETSVLWNDGDDGFQFQPLPRLAQLSPSFGVAVTDVNADGHPDIYLAQNFFTPQAETGRMDGGLGLLLTGTGNRVKPFLPMWPKQSGMAVSGDAKSLTITDLNGDHRPDFVVGVNNGPIEAFESQASSGDGGITVRLDYATGNPSAVGARVTLVLNGAMRRTAELYSSVGYLSQSSSELFFGLDAAAQVAQIEVRWPDGSVSTESFEAPAAVVSIRHCLP